MNAWIHLCALVGFLGLGMWAVHLHHHRECLRVMFRLAYAKSIPLGGVIWPMRVIWDYAQAMGIPCYPHKNSIYDHSKPARGNLREIAFYLSSLNISAVYFLELDSVWIQLAPQAKPYDRLEGISQELALKLGGGVRVQVAEAVPRSR